MSKSWKLAGVAAVAVAAVAAMFLLPVNQWLRPVVEWIRDAGWPGVLVFALVYVVAAVFMLPGSALTLGAGFAYGPLWGVLLVSPVSVLAATAAFTLGRTALLARVRRRIDADPRFAAVDRAVARQGFRIVLLLRLSPVFPFSLLNYALASTRIRSRDFVLASFIGMLPGTVLYVYLGSLVTSAGQLAGGERPSGGAAQQALYWGGLACALVVTVLITRIARRALREALDTGTATTSPSGVTP